MSGEVEKLAVDVTIQGLGVLGFWIGLGIAAAGFFIGCGLESCGKDAVKAWKNVT